MITEDSLLSVIDRLKTYRIEIIEKLVSRTGAIDKIRSIYIRDLDGNLIEISSYEKPPLVL